LSDKRTTTANAGSASTAVSTTQQGSAASKAANTQAESAATPAAPIQGAAIAAGQQADGKSSKPQGGGDKVTFTGAEDKATAASFATSAFDANTKNGEGRDGNTGSSGSDRGGDAFASYAASTGHTNGEGVTATTTTAFPLHQVTSVVTTATDASHALGAAAAASANGTSGAGGANGANAASATLASQIADTDAAQNVIRSMRLQWSGSAGEAQLRLEPEHLGQVFVSVRVDQGNVSATLQADSASAQQWIQTHQQELRQALQDQGLRVTHFNVTTNPDDRRQGAPQQDQRDQQQSGARARNDRQPTDGRIFEVRV